MNNDNKTEILEELSNWIKSKLRSIESPEEMADLYLYITSCIKEYFVDEVRHKGTDFHIEFVMHLHLDNTLENRK